MTRTREQIETQNKLLRAEYGDLFDSVAEVLFRHDPIGINFEHNTDEYYPEVRTILPKLRTCASAKEVMSVVYQEFQKWFDSDLAGTEEGYTRHQPLRTGATTSELRERSGLHTNNARREVAISDND
jgi:hypothetical protein